ncbi:MULTISPECIES: DUF4260 domain-containing protein [unclassified Streptomyces]|uniref:DUF4260 domain-containing protein n=1 Tax=unclassified Streptomyces TaxID=2593676 RepID=UPI0013B72CB0|nr:DUF4260 domain-containing protein [Streptomyces sp. SID14446]NEB30197.1 DUF4260 domain-containing protein [Streptomyces sp. SID14446]
MDAKNTFDTPVTYRLIRVEYAVGLAVAVGFFFAHITEVRWLPAVALFLYIDLIGYIPGAIAYHRSEDKAISKVYYVLYNTMHSLATQTIVALAWIWLAGPEWALLVLPIHLFGDRALFGNFLKPFGLDFEPVADPAFQRFRSEFAASAADGTRLIEQLDARPTP